MSKVLEASCVANVVSVGALPIPSATVLSEGVGASEGILILDKDLAVYLTSNAADLKQALEKVAAIVTKISTTLTSIGAGMAGVATAPPPTLASDVADLTAKVVELNALKEMLK